MIDPSSVHTRRDLERFLYELSELARRGELRLENDSAADILEAASGWVQDMEGVFLNRGEALPTTPTWQLIAEVFYGSLFYE